MRVTITEKDALLVIDVQVDFLPGGALAVAGGDKVIAPLNDYSQRFFAAGAPVYYTRDWHPHNHLSFRDNGGIWPAHCLADRPGASFPPSLTLPSDNKFIISKGVMREFDAYSGFQGTPLRSLLQERGIRRCFVGGLATEYCVKSTVEGALNLGYATFLLIDAIQGIELNSGDMEQAIRQMLFGGAVAVSLADLD